MKSKIAISIEAELVERLDRLIASKVFPNRSRAIETALREKIKRLQGNRLAAECAKLDPEFEKRLAEEALGAMEEWPEY